MDERRRVTISFLLGFVSLIGIATASVVSVGDFNKDFFIAWSPSHVNTSADGHERSLKLDQESGKFTFRRKNISLRVQKT